MGTIEADPEGLEVMMCDHRPACPSCDSPDCCTAHVVVDHMDQGWCRLCNGVILFDDGHYLTPDGREHDVPQLSA